jgi:hypothetical protein
MIMQAHRVETTIDKDKILVIKDIPFQPGDRVEVIILERSPEVKQAKRYPLRGKPIRYEQPTEPVAVEDWEVMK